MIETVFADTVYWVAVAKPDDPYKALAEGARQRLGNVRIVTTDEVLAEFLTLLSRQPTLREVAAKMVREILANPNVEVIPQSRDSFLSALRFYEERLDKGYSHTDCSSMTVMKRRGIDKVLTHDHHFAQEGLSVLM